MFWQTSSSGNVVGISGNVDKNIFEGSEADLQINLHRVNMKPWDFNKDGVVNYLDLGQLADHWLVTENDPDWDPKFNLDGTPELDVQLINYLDLGVLADHWLE